MSILNHLAQAAAVLLLLELLVLVVILAAVFGGLAFGLWWVRGKTDWAFGKANDYVRLVPKYTQTGTDYVAKPFIVASSTSERVKGTARALRRRVSDVQAARRSSQGTVPYPEVAPGPGLAVASATGADSAALDQTTP